MPRTTFTARDAAGLRAWLRTLHAEVFLTDAVLGCLPDDEAADVAADYGYDLDRRDDRVLFGIELNAALAEGF